MNSVVNPLKRALLCFPPCAYPHANKCQLAEEVRKYLRVILLDDGETVHNAFFDRNFKEEGK